MEKNEYLEFNRDIYIKFGERTSENLLNSSEEKKARKNKLKSRLKYILNKFLRKLC